MGTDNYIRTVPGEAEDGLSPSTVSYETLLVIAEGDDEFVGCIGMYDNDDCDEYGDPVLILCLRPFPGPEIDAYWCDVRRATELEARRWVKGQEGALDNLAALGIHDGDAGVIKDDHKDPQ